MNMKTFIWKDMSHGPFTSQSLNTHLLLVKKRIKMAKIVLLQTFVQDDQTGAYSCNQRSGLHRKEGKVPNFQPNIFIYDTK